MTDIDSFLEDVAHEVLGQLDSLSPADGQVAHWLAVGRATGVELTPARDGEPHELQQAAIDQGADAVAYVSHISGYNEQILAYVLVATPRNSDIRRSRVSRREGAASLGPWEYAV